jgi:hypothetical protein
MNGLLLGGVQREQTMLSPEGFYRHQHPEENIPFVIRKPGLPVSPP